MKLHFIPKIFKGIIIFLLVFKIEVAFGQTPELIRFDGSNRNYITCMLEKDDFIWVGTYNDGIRKINSVTGEIEILKEDSSGLKGKYINDMLIDKSGKIWISAGNCLNVYDGKNWMYYDSTNSTIHYPFYHCLAVDSTGKIWVIGYPNELSSFDGNEWKSYDVVSKTDNNNIKNIQIDKFNNIWILSNKEGLIKFDGINKTSFDTLKSLIPDLGYSFIAFDKKNNLWISGYNGELIKNDGKNWTLIHAPADDINYYIGSILFDIQNNLIITTNHGIKKYNGSDWSVIKRNNSNLSDEAVIDILIDKHYNYWIATYYDGLIKDTLGQYNQIDLKLKGLLLPPINTLKVDKTNRKLILSSDGLTVLESDKWDIWTSYNSNLPGINKTYHTVSFDDKGYIWIDTDNDSLWRFNDSISENISEKYPDYVSGFIYDIINHKNGYIYITSRKGISRYKDDIWEIVLPWNNIKYQNVIDDNGVFWTDSLGTVGYYNGEKWVFDLTKTIQGYYYEYSIFNIDSKGNKWINTENALLKFDGNNWNKYICPLVQTPNDYAWKMTIDNKDNIWLLSQKGDLAKFDGINWKVYQKLIDLVGYYNENISFEADTLNNIWFSVKDRGIYVFKEDGVDLTSVENPNVNELNMIIVYPNPAGNIINLGSSVITGEKYIISDISGREIQTGILESNELNISNLSKGAYYIMIMSYTGKQTVQFIKN